MSESNHPTPSNPLSLVADDMRQVDTVIALRLRSSVPLIGEISHYIISAGGKRLRPVILLAACEACGGDLYQRDDDREDVIRRRLSVYHEQTSPLEAYYDAKGLLRRVNGEGATDAVLRCLEGL